MIDMGRDVWPVGPILQGFAVRQRKHAPEEKWPNDQ